MQTESEDNCVDYRLANDSLHKLGFIHSYPQCTRQELLLYTLHRIVNSDSPEGFHRLFPNVLPMHMRLVNVNELQKLAQAFKTKQAKCAGYFNMPVDVIKIQEMLITYCD